MGNLVAIIITLVIFSMEAKDGSYGSAFIFATIMGGMSWVAFGWNINDKTPTSANSSTKISNKPLFIIGKPSLLFSKKQLTPTEFGREITRFGFRMGVDEFDHYLKNPQNTPEDQQLLDIVKKNPGFIQLLYANLITGAFLCYVKVLLHTPDNVIDIIKMGIFSELQATMPEMNADIVKNHLKITEDFASTIEREIRQIEENSSSLYFLEGLTLFYQSLSFNNESIFPKILFSSLCGYGSRVMALCQNDFKITLKLG